MSPLKRLRESLFRLLGPVDLWIFDYLQSRIEGGGGGRRNLEMLKYAPIFEGPKRSFSGSWHAGLREIRATIRAPIQKR